MQRDELAAWLRLALNPPLGPQAARRLLAAFGLPHQVLAQSSEALAQVVDGKRIEALHREPPGLAPLLDATLAWIAEDPAAFVASLEIWAAFAFRRVFQS